MANTDASSGELSSINAQALEALVDMLRAANSEDAREAQTILMRRLALQGDVVSSRIPAPRNITEIGGYINLLSTLDQPEMRAQMLAGILGVAGPNPPLGWLSGGPSLSMVTLANDRPEGPQQAVIPLSFTVRSDFSSAVQAALEALRAAGGAIPLLASAYSLPPALPGTPPPADALPYLGRVMDVVPAVALRDAASDPVAIGRAEGSDDDYVLLVRVEDGAAGASAGWEILICDADTCVSTPVDDAFMMLAPALATAGFYPASPLPVPSSLSSIAWSRLTNRTGLMSGATKLGDELAVLYRVSEIMASAFAPYLHWVWDGSSFAPAP